MAGIERHRASLLYADPDDPYFQRLLRGLREGSARVDVVPYSFTAPANAAPALEAMLARSLGGTVSVALAPAVSYGGESRRSPRCKVRAVRRSSRCSTPPRHPSAKRTGDSSRRSRNRAVRW